MEVRHNEAQQPSRLQPGLAEAISHHRSTSGFVPTQIPTGRVNSQFKTSSLTVTMAGKSANFPLGIKVLDKGSSPGLTVEQEEYEAMKRKIRHLQDTISSRQQTKQMSNSAGRP